MTLSKEEIKALMHEAWNEEDGGTPTNNWRDMLIDELYPVFEIYNRKLLNKLALDNNAKV